MYPFSSLLLPADVRWETRVIYYSAVSLTKNIYPIWEKHVFQILLLFFIICSYGHLFSLMTKIESKSRTHFTAGSMRIARTGLEDDTEKSLKQNQC